MQTNAPGFGRVSWSRPFAAETSVDCMTGRPLNYEINPDDTFALCSAGEDGRDDDALGDDVAWPQPGLPTRVTLPATGAKLPAFSVSNAPQCDVLVKL